MSVYVTREVWKFSRAEHGALLTLLAIADSAHKDYGTSRLKQTSIASMTRLDVRAVRDAVRWLEEHLEIETRQAMKGRARLNVYRVILGEYEQAEVDPDDLGLRLLEPFSTVAELAERRAATNSDGRQILPVVAGPTSGSFRSDDRQFLPSHKEEPVLDQVTEEANASSVPAGAGERETRKQEISLALSALLGLELRGMTRAERSKWETAIAQLVKVGATRAQVEARCVAYRAIWPSVRLTAWALVTHWSELGAAVVSGAGADPVAAWCERAPEMFELDVARELLDDRAGLTDDQRTVYHRRLDEAYALQRQVA